MNSLLAEARASRPANPKRWTVDHFSGDGRAFFNAIFKAYTERLEKLKNGEAGFENVSDPQQVIGFEYGPEEENPLDQIPKEEQSAFVEAAINNASKKGRKLTARGAAIDAAKLRDRVKFETEEAQRLTQAEIISRSASMNPNTMTQEDKDREEAIKANLPEYMKEVRAEVFRRHGVKMYEKDYIDVEAAKRENDRATQKRKREIDAIFE